MAGKIELSEKHPLLPVKKNDDGTKSVPIVFMLVDPFDEEEYLISEEFINSVDKIKNSGEIKDDKAKYKKIDRDVRKKRINKLKEKYTYTDSKLLVHMLTVVHTNYENSMKNDDDSSYEAFVYELSEFAYVLLKDIKKKQDKINLLEENMSDELWETFGMDKDKKSILHYATEKNLSQVAEYIYENFPSLLLNEYEEGNVIYLPLDLALKPKDRHGRMAGCDETASFLIKKTDKETLLSKLIVEEDSEGEEEKTCCSFLRKLCDVESPEEDEEPDPEPYKLKFSELVKRKDMKKTVMSILDDLMDLRWPFNYVIDSDMTDIPNMPIRYHFNFNLLECDEEGRILGHSKYKGKSCLQALIEGPHKESAMKHPVVRKLVNEKWKKPFDICCGAEVTYNFIVKFFLAMYSLYLVLMSFSFFLQPLYRPANTYEDRKDYFRLFCECGTLVFTFFYLIAEIIQVRLEGLNTYLGCGERGFSLEFESFMNGFFNICDILGSLLIIVIVPFHLSGNQEAECIIAGFAYFINFLRIFKFLPAMENIGIYSRTFAVIVFKDLYKFLVMLFVIMMSFTGSAYLFMRSNGKLKKVGDFWDILFKETLVLTQAQGFEDEYDSEKYSVYLIIFLMLNMFCIMVVLLNFLIGQISYRYAIALETAKINYDIDRTKLIITAEALVAFLCRGKRLPMKAIYVKNDTDLQDMIKYWIEMKKEEKKGEEISREFMALSGGAYSPKQNED